MIKRFLLMCCLLSTSVLAQDNIEQVIQVNGQASTKQAPDILTFSIYVEEKGQQADKLSDIVNKRTAQITDALQNNDVAKKDIQSLAVNLYPWYEREGNEQVQKGFVFNRSVNVTLRDFKRYPQILDDLMTLGATRIDGYQFEVENPETSYLFALQQAIANAQVKAQSIAAASQLTLGQIVGVIEQSSYNPAPSNRGYKLSMAESDSFLPGEKEIQAQVQVTFAIMHPSQSE